MSSAGLDRARAKMEDAGIDPVAIDTFAHYYRLLEHGAIPARQLAQISDEALQRRLGQRQPERARARSQAFEQVRLGRLAHDVTHSCIWS